MGMASDHVPAAVKIAYLVRIEKCARAKEASCDEKVAFPATTIEFLGGVEGPLAAVVKCNQDGFFKFSEIKFRHNLWGETALRNPIQMGRKCVARLLVGERRAPLEPRLRRIIGHVVIQKRCNFSSTSKHSNSL